MRTSILLCLTALLPCLSGSLAAQRTESGSAAEAAPDGGVQGAARTKGDARRAEKGELIDKEDGREGENLTPEQRLERNITSGASAHCRFQAALRPAKLLPGQSGMLLVTAILLGEAVLPAPPPLELTSSPQQGSVTLGGLMVRSAEPGRLAKGYLGRPVYDNYAVFEVPVTLAADAQIGKRYPLFLDLKFDLYDGASAQPIGRFLDRVATEVEVGAVLDPEVRGVNRSNPAAQPASEPVVPSSVPPQPDAQPDAPPAAVVRPGTAVVAPDAPAVVAPAKPEPVAGLPVDDGGGGDTILLVVGGGILLVLIVLLLARRK